MTQRVTPHLMFIGQAEEAMNLYVSVFQDGAITQIQRYGPGEQGAEGSVRRAIFTLAGQEFACIDSPPMHDFTFTPSFSLFVDFTDREELDAVYERLSAGGAVLMPLGTYEFSDRFAWINDRFGVSWQLNLV